MVGGGERAPGAGEGEGVGGAGAGKEFVHESGEEVVARAHGVGHLHAVAVVGVGLAVAVVDCAVRAEGYADVRRADGLGEVVQVLFEAVVGRAEFGGQFVQLVVVEFDQVGAAHQFAHALGPVVRLAQVHVEHFEAGGIQQGVEGGAGGGVARGEAAEHQRVGVGDVFKRGGGHGDFVPGAGVNDVV